MSFETLASMKKRGNLTYSALKDILARPAEERRSWPRSSTLSTRASCFPPHCFEPTEASPTTTTKTERKRPSEKGREEKPAGPRRVTGEAPD